MYTKTQVNQLLTGLATSYDITSAISGKADQSTTYAKSDVDTLSTGKPNFPIFRNPAPLNPPVQGFPLLGGGNMFPGIAIAPPLTLTKYGTAHMKNCLAIYIAQKAGNIDKVY